MAYGYVLRSCYFFRQLFYQCHGLLPQKRSGCRATRPIRDNRTNKCTRIHEMKKKNRGTYDYNFDATASLILDRWKDNSIVTMLTNCDSVEALENVKRYHYQLHKRKLLFKNYHGGMGGAHMINQICQHLQKMVDFIHSFHKYDSYAYRRIV